MSRTRVLLLRHAESAVPDVFHGAESDIGLSARGERQARVIAPILAAEEPAAVICSAMRRAVATAQPIAAASGVELRIEPDLHERRVGSLSGLPFDALDGLWPKTLRRWMHGDTSYAPPHMESFDDIRMRVLPVWRRLAKDLAGQTYIVVAHGVVNKVLLMSLEMGIGPADWNSFRSANVGVHELELETGKWRLLQANVVPEVVRAL
jgi:broad specificity phosphatase PhoE